MDDSDSDSSMPRRSQNTTTAAMPPMPKAMRQPQAMNCSSGSKVDSSATVPEARHRPIASPICGSDA
ncbi:hypothetical protein G6F64_014657 [Rhizopus arrhizus]|uniref:Uncharacterized protein n=1 Tax=Rhizopus oryzae TaxID=64495 RepID=A0A9P7BJD9_RHIOR|nr:hypothetical protein G6F64_014657 [Rhizopus arrhizus]